MPLSSTLIKEDLPSRATFGRFLAHLLIDAGWKQKELAKRAGLSESHISHLLSDRQKPNQKTLLKIILGLGWNEDNPKAQRLLSLRNVNREGSRGF